MQERRRWDTDTRFRGVRDASPAGEAVTALLDALQLDGWVAEDPEVHLRARLEAAAAALGLAVGSFREVDGILELDLEVADRSAIDRRIAAHGLIGSIAEASTHVRQINGSTFEVVTGMLPGDGEFATHGHLVRIHVIGRAPTLDAEGAPALDAEGAPAVDAGG